MMPSTICAELWFPMDMEAGFSLTHKKLRFAAFLSLMSRKKSSNASRMAQCWSNARSGNIPLQFVFRFCQTEVVVQAIVNPYIHSIFSDLSCHPKTIWPKITQTYWRWKIRFWNCCQSVCTPKFNISEILGFRVAQGLIELHLIFGVKKTFVGGCNIFSDLHTFRIQVF